MLQVDPTLSDHELSLLVAKRCAAAGKVLSVKIHRRPRLFALVDMATDDATCQLAAQVGRPPIGTAVVVHLAETKKND